MTFAEMKTELAARGFDYLSDTRLSYYINAGMHELVSIDQWPFRVVTQSGPIPYTLEDPLAVIQEVRVTAERRSLAPIDRESLADIFADLTMTGTPTYYYLDRESTTGIMVTTLRCYPVATPTVAIRYLITDQTLAGDSDQCNVPVVWQRLIVDIAVRMAYRDADNHEAAEAVQVQIDRDLMIMRVSLLVENSDGPDGYVTPTEGW